MTKDYTSEHHSFDINLATELGSIDEAIIVHHFQHWINVNIRNKKNYYDNRTWTYQTNSRIAAHFPYWNEKHVWRTIKKLVDKGVLITGNYNKTKFDRTTWYAFKNEENFTISQKWKMEVSKVENGFPESVGPIPDTKEQILKTNKSSRKSTSSPTPSQDSLRLVDLFIELLIENNPKAKIPDKKKWAKEIDKINRIDGYSWQEIENIIRFSQEDEFWQTNILSASKLRKQAAQLTLRMKKTSKSKQKHQKEVDDYKHTFNYVLRWEEKFPGKVFAHRQKAKVRVNGNLQEIFYSDHGFREQFENSVRKAGLI